MISGKTNVSSNTVLAGHVDNFKSQMAEVLIIPVILVIFFIPTILVNLVTLWSHWSSWSSVFIIRWSTFRRIWQATGQLWGRFF